jgi:hypothetical protein
MVKRNRSGIVIAFDNPLGLDNFCDDIALMLGEERRPSKFWQICWKYISPLILLVIRFCLYSSMK